MNSITPYNCYMNSVTPYKFHMNSLIAYNFHMISQTRYNWWILHREILLPMGYTVYVTILVTISEHLGYLSSEANQSM